MRRKIWSGRDVAFDMVGGGVGLKFGGESLGGMQDSGGESVVRGGGGESIPDIRLGGESSSGIRSGGESVVDSISGGESILRAGGESVARDISGGEAIDIRAVFGGESISTYAGHGGESIEQISLRA